MSRGIHLDAEFDRLRACVQRELDAGRTLWGQEPISDDTQRDMLSLICRNLRSEVLFKPRCLRLRSIAFAEACDFVGYHHRHHQPPRGWKFGVAVEDHLGLVGVAMAGRPVSRVLDDGQTIEITRVCTLVGADNAASKLIGALCRVSHSLGYHRIISYTLAEEPGTTYKACGFTAAAQVAGRSWSCPSRPRDTPEHGPKQRWEKLL